MDNDVFQLTVQVDPVVVVADPVAQDSVAAVAQDDSFTMPEQVKTAPIDMNGFDLDQTPFQDPNWISGKELAIAWANQGDAVGLHIVDVINHSGDAVLIHQAADGHWFM